MKLLLVVAGCIGLLSAGWWLYSAGASSNGGKPINAPGFIQGGPVAVSANAHIVTPTPPEIAAAAATGTASPAARSVASPAKPRGREWKRDFLDQFHGAAAGDSISFILIAPERASGVIQTVQHKANQVIRVSGTLSKPEAGRFFFQRQTAPGKAGEFVGVVEFPKSERAYRLEPSAQTGGTELVERPLKEVVCLRMPRADEGLAGEIPPLKPSEFPTVPIPEYQDGIVVLQSLPGARAVVYLDFRGGSTDTWGGITYDRPTLNNAQIKDVWVRVAEDFMPFEVNVTTDLQVFELATEESRQRVVITPTSTAAPGAGGVAYIGSYNWTGDTPCWVFMIGGKSCAEAISHEVGHTLGLTHDGSDVNGVHNEYYGGQGGGDVGWAPIMGVGYSQPVTQWSKGEYANANNQQDDLNVIATSNNDVAYRSDDTLENFEGARFLDVYPNFSVRAQGVIAETGDVDAFRFSTTTGGTVMLRADPANPGPNLALQIALFAASGQRLIELAQLSTVWTAISTNVAAGDYVLKVSGAGRNSPVFNGFSSYGSLGYYSVTGSVPGGRVTEMFPVAENSPAGTVVGTVSVPQAAGRSLRLDITRGNEEDGFAIDSSGVITVKRPEVLDYERLALATQFPVAFELWVDAVDAADGTVVEAQKRVLISVGDVNEAPRLEPLTTKAFAGTRPGTLIGRLAGSDPDFYTVLNYWLREGNEAGFFTNNPTTGELFVARTLPADGPATYEMIAEVGDISAMPVSQTARVVVNVLPAPAGLEIGAISYTVYTNISGNVLSPLTSNPRFPSRPDLERALPKFEADTNRGDSFGGVLRGYVLPPVSGEYTFWIASDDNGELWLSNSSEPAAMTRIAHVSGEGIWTDAREWDKYATQRGEPVFLEAGQAYYVEARYKEGAGNDHLAVAWQSAAAGIEGREIIPGKYLAIYRPAFRPLISGFNTKVHRNTIQGSLVGRVRASDFNPDDQVGLSIVSGGFGGLFQLDAASGEVRVVDADALSESTHSSVFATIRATDSSAAAHYADATVTISLVEPNAIVATSVYQEIWTNIGTSTQLQSLTNNSRYPRRPDLLVPLSSLQTQRDRGDAYGTRIRGRIQPPVSSLYSLFVSSDDNSALRLSTNAEPAFLVQVASVNGYTDYQQWDRFFSQRSASLSLVVGNHYFFDVIHKEGTGGDHLSVGWFRPGGTGTNVIEGAYLLPADLNHAPVLFGQAAQLYRTATNGLRVLDLNAIDSPLDTFTYKIESGNVGQAFAIEPDTGELFLTNHVALGQNPTDTWNLEVLVQDSGYGGLFPRKSATATVTIRVLEDQLSLTWSGGGADAKWSTAANWQSRQPVEGEALVFEGVLWQTNSNDLLSNAGAVSLARSGFEISGNPLNLLGPLTSTGDNTWAVDTKYISAQGVRSASGTLRLPALMDNGGSDLTFWGEGDFVVSGSIHGNGGLAHLGPGTLVLVGTNAYLGATTVSGGTLKIYGASAISSSAGLAVEGPGRLDVREVSGGFAVGVNQRITGSGVVLGQTEVRGTVDPGNGYGALTFSNSVTLKGVSIFNVARTAAGLTNSAVRSVEPVRLDGALIVNVLGTELRPGDSFRLLEAPALEGQFSRVELPKLPGPLAWNTGGLLVDGILGVQFTAPMLRYSMAGAESLEVELPDTEAGYTYELQSATELRPGAVWTKLVAVQGGTGPLRAAVPVSRDGGGLFLRVVIF